MQFTALLVDSFRETLDRKIFWVMVAITLMVVLAMFCIAFEPGHVTLLFGAWSWSTEIFNPETPAGRTAIAGIAVNIMDFFLGWIGTILLIIACADAFPNLMERGAIDVVLAKPISRPRLFLYKYICSMVFILMIATLFVVLTFLIVGARWNLWRWGYLYCIPLSVLLFSYVYCITVYVGVRTRSTITAILLSLVMWFVCWVSSYSASQVEANPALRQFKEKPLGRLVRFVGAIPPKTSEVTYLSHRWSGGSPGDELMEGLPEGGAGAPFMDASGEPSSNMFDLRNMLAVEKHLMQVSAAWSIGSSLVFEAVVILLGMWTFSRRDF